MRASGSDEALKLTPPSILSLEQAIEFIDEDELFGSNSKKYKNQKKNS